MKISAILLAAGFSSRFGTNKLLFPIEGEGMFERTYKKVVSSGRFSEIIVVTQYEELAQLAKESKIVRNLHPEEGISSSLKLGVSAADKENALMFFVCDQPFLSVETIVGMTEAFEGGILSASDSKNRGNPVIFDACYRQELMALSGDVGGRQVILAHPNDGMEYRVKDPMELWDVDTWENRKE